MVKFYSNSGDIYYDDKEDNLQIFRCGFEDAEGYIEYCCETVDDTVINDYVEDTLRSMDDAEKYPCEEDIADVRFYLRLLIDHALDVYEYHHSKEENT